MTGAMTRTKLNVEGDTCQDEQKDGELVVGWSQVEEDGGQSSQEQDEIKEAMVPQDTPATWGTTTTRKMRTGEDVKGLGEISRAMIDACEVCDIAPGYYSDEDPLGQYRTILPTGAATATDNDDGKKIDISVPVRQNVTNKTVNDKDKMISHEKKVNSPKRKRRWGLKKIERRDSSSSSDEEESFIKAASARSSGSLDGNEKSTRSNIISTVSADLSESGNEMNRMLQPQPPAKEESKEEESSTSTNQNIEEAEQKENLGKFLPRLSRFTKSKSQEKLVNTNLSGDDPLRKKRHGNTDIDEEEVEAITKDELVNSPVTAPISTNVTSTSSCETTTSLEEQNMNQASSKKMEGFGGGDVEKEESATGINTFSHIFQTFQQRRLISRREFDVAGLTEDELNKLKEDVTMSKAKNSMDSMAIDNNDPGQGRMGKRDWMSFFGTFTKAALAPDEYLDQLADPEDGEGNLGMYGQVPLGDSEHAEDERFSIDKKSLRKMRMDGDAPGLADIAQSLIDDCEESEIPAYYSDEEPLGRYRTILGVGDDEDKDIDNKGKSDGNDNELKTEDDLKNGNKVLQEKIVQLEEELRKSSQEKDLLIQKVKGLEQKLETVLKTQNITYDISGERVDESKDEENPVNLFQIESRDHEQNKSRAEYSDVIISSQIEQLGLNDEAKAEHSPQRHEQCPQLTATVDKTEENLLTLEADLLKLEEDLLIFEEELSTSNRGQNEIA